ncbi:unnamed protein product, partial [Tetraodon nigroviridis]
QPRPHGGAAVPGRVLAGPGVLPPLVPAQLAQSRQLVLGGVLGQLAGRPAAPRPARAASQERRRGHLLRKLRVGRRRRLCRPSVHAAGGGQEVAAGGGQEVAANGIRRAAARVRNRQPAPKHAADQSDGRREKGRRPEARRSRTGAPPRPNDGKRETQEEVEEEAAPAGAAAGRGAGDPAQVRRRERGEEEKSWRFRPFVHVDERTCVIVNFREDEDSVRAGLGAGRSAPPSFRALSPTRPAVSRAAAPQTASVGRRCCAASAVRRPTPWPSATCTAPTDPPAQRGVSRTGTAGPEGPAPTLVPPRRRLLSSGSTRTAGSGPPASSWSGGGCTAWRRRPGWPRRRCVPCANRLVQLWDVS